MSLRCALLAALSLSAAMEAAEPAGFRKGESGYVRHWPGELQVVLSVPHDGAARPADIADRKTGVIVRDTHAAALATAIRDAMRARFGRAPHLVVCDLSRRKVDCNREIKEGAQGDPAAEKVWKEYHATIDEAERDVLRRTPYGLYLDVHSHGHPKKRMELGYLLTAEDLRQPDEKLDHDKAYRLKSSIRWLAERTQAGFSELVRGRSSMGGLLEERGVAAVPSHLQRPEKEEPYFNGAFDVAAHGSRDKAQLDGIQLEVPGPMRDTEEHRGATAKAVAEAVEAYFRIHFRTELRPKDAQGR
ncbi:MAG: hypothetical protein ACO3ND_03030 [Opitutales bacterium]